MVGSCLCFEGRVLARLVVGRMRVLRAWVRRRCRGGNRGLRLLEALFLFLCD